MSREASFELGTTSVSFEFLSLPEYYKRILFISVYATLHIYDNKSSICEIALK